MTVATKDLPDSLLAAGVPSITVADAAERLRLPMDQARVALARLMARRRLFSPARGLYVVVPAEYRSWGVVPAEWFVDDMMRHLKRDYYVGLLSAAAMHGASHQAPQVFQVMVSSALRDRTFGRVRMRFYRSRHVINVPCESRTVATGTVRLASREATAVDLVALEREAGGLSNVATLLAELAEFAGEELARCAGPHPRAVARRLGWLCELVDASVDLGPLRAIAAPAIGTPALLDSRAPRRGRTDAAWGIRINSVVEPEL